MRIRYICRWLTEENAVPIGENIRSVDRAEGDGVPIGEVAAAIRRHCHGLHGLPAFTP